MKIKPFKIYSWLKDRSTYTVRIMLYLLGFIVILALIIILKFSSIDAFLGALAGGFIGFIGSFLLKDFSLYVEDKIKTQTRKENTKFVYEMYKMELEQNIRHLQHLIDKKWIPYYRLKSITRDSLWGQLTDYSKDLDLFRKLNVVYQEFELINNKIEIMNTLRLALLSPRDGLEKSRLEDDQKGQIGGAIELGKNVILLAQECITIINVKISQI
jgi:hypothetical protein